MNYKLIKGECLEVMQNIPDGGIDAVICDPPYGTIACRWDTIIPLNDNVIVDDKMYYYDEWMQKSYIDGVPHGDARKYFDDNKRLGMWSHLCRIVKPKGSIVLFGAFKTLSQFYESNKAMYSYEIVWHKNRVSNFANAKYMPLREHEYISVFINKGEGERTYNPIRKMRSKESLKRYPKGKIGTRKRVGSANKRNQHFSLGIVCKDDTVDHTGLRNPGTVISYKTMSGTSGKIQHPTQKPVDLMEYLVKTYTNESDTVLDFTMGSGTTGVACGRTNRKFVGIELDDKYFEIAEYRIKNTYGNYVPSKEEKDKGQMMLL